MRARVFLFSCLLMSGIFSIGRAEDPAVDPNTEPPGDLVRAVDDVLKDLGSFDGNDLPDSVAVSPYTRDEDVARYRENLVEWENGPDQRETKLCGPWSVEENLAYVLLLRSDPTNPVSLEVLPLCLVKVEGEWKAAPGLHHYDHAPIGFVASRLSAARRMSRDARRHALLLQNQLREAAMDELRGRISERRNQWANDDSPKRLITRYMRFDQGRDVIGKAACFDLPDRIPIEEMIVFMDKLKETVWETYDGGRDDPLIGNPLFLDERELEDGSQRVDMVGFVHQRNPADCFVVPFFSKRSGSGRLLIPLWYELSGMSHPGDELMDWSSVEESRAQRLIPRSLAADVRAESPGEAHRMFLEALRRGDHGVVYGLIWMPDIDRVEEDQWMEWLGALSNEILPGTGTVPLLRMMDVTENDGFAVSHAVIFQPALAEPMIIHGCHLWKSERGWKLVPDLGAEQPETSHKADPARVKLFREFQSDNRIAIGQRLADAARLFFNPGENGYPETSEETVERLVAAARDGDCEAFFRLVGEPLVAGSDVQSLVAVGRLLRDIRELPDAASPAAKTKEGWAGISLPVFQPRRAENVEPRRLIFLRESVAGWYLVPGFEYFREVNRGFRLLNARARRIAEEHLGPEEFKVVEELREWNENPADSTSPLP